MKILAIEKETQLASAEGFRRLGKDEALKVWELHQKGVVRELYFRADRSTALLMLECTGLKEAKNCLAELPLVEAGLIEFELIPLIAYPGFARLFSS